MHLLFTVLRILALASIPLTVTSVGLSGVVACFTDDGGFAVKANGGADCFCPSSDGKVPSHPSFRSRENCGAECICIPLSSDWRTTLARGVTEKEIAAKSLSFTTRPDAPLSFGKTLQADTRDSHPTKRKQPPPPLFRLALRTVVLLT